MGVFGGSGMLDNSELLSMLIALERRDEPVRMALGSDGALSCSPWAHWGI